MNYVWNVMWKYSRSLSAELNESLYQLIPSTLLFWANNSTLYFFSFSLVICGLPLCHIVTFFYSTTIKGLKTTSTWALWRSFYNIPPLWIEYKQQHTTWNFSLLGFTTSYFYKKYHTHTRWYSGTVKSIKLSKQVHTKTREELSWRCFTKICMNRNFKGRIFKIFVKHTKCLVLLNRIYFLYSFWFSRCFVFSHFPWGIPHPNWKFAQFAPLPPKCEKSTDKKYHHAQCQ